MRTSHTIPLAIVCGGLILAAAVYASVRTEDAVATKAGNAALVRPVDASDYILGNPLAPVKIVLYADFDCTYCKTYHDTLRAVIADAGIDGNVAWVYRQFPLTELYPNAKKHAQAALCAGQAGGQQGFWAFAHALYAHQPVDPSRYGELAQEARIPSEPFIACYTNAASQVDARIAADRQNALDTGARGAPYAILLINDKPPLVLDGAYSDDALRAILKNAVPR